jgi:hypothetical protein
VSQGGEVEQGPLLWFRSVPEFVPVSDARVRHLQTRSTELRLPKGTARRETGVYRFPRQNLRPIFRAPAAAVGHRRGGEARDGSCALIARLPRASRARTRASAWAAEAQLVFLFHPGMTARGTPRDATSRRRESKQREHFLRQSATAAAAPNREGAAAPTDPSATSRWSV